MIKKSKELKIKELEKKSQEYLEGWKRCMADWKNYKAQQDERDAEIRRIAKESFALELLGILDNFSLALEHLPNTKESDSWEAGIRHIKAQMEEVLNRLGIVEIGAKKGDNFNPHEHECFEDPKCENKENLVIEEVILKGYKIDDKLLRPVRVKVDDGKTK